jgi:hypothetical protein
MLRTLTFVTCIIGLAGGASSALAAPPKAHRHKPVHQINFVDPQPPLTVNRRSWLDPGPVVPVGTTNNYVTANTIFNRTPDQTSSRSKFGNEALPAPLEVPGRPASILEFETPGYP